MSDGTNVPLLNENKTNQSPISINFNLNHPASRGYSMTQASSKSNPINEANVPEPQSDSKLHASELKNPVSVNRDVSRGSTQTSFGDTKERNFKYNFNHKGTLPTNLKQELTVN